MATHSHDGRTAGLLLIVPAEAGEAVPPSTPVAGLPLLLRIVLAAARAGLRPILAPGLDTSSLPAGTVAVELAAVGPAVAEGQRIVLCPANVIPQPRWLRALAGAAAEAETLYVDTSTVALIETRDPCAILSEAARFTTLDALVAAIGQRLRRVPASFDTRGRFRLTASGDVGAAETWLLRSLVKDSEGFMSRHFERRLSLAVTRRLVATGITPNAMTFVSLTVGLSSAPFFLSARPVWQLTGALLFLAHSILDGCDGELARIKFLESRYGAMLDFWGDNVVHVAVFGCMAVGWSRASHSVLPLLLGLAAVGAVGLATAALSGTGLQPRPAGAEPAGARIVDALANRDFVYLVLALSTVGRAWWFVALVAAGTPIFVLVVLLAHRDRRAT